MKALNCFLVFFVLAFQPLQALSPSQALARLLEGNKRYAEDKLLHADHSSIRRNSILQKQQPFATVLTCSDSRVTPEIIFDQGTGDLFVVRIAGNVAGPIELDSIDFSVKVLGSSLILVLGHQSCGAVKAVIEKNTQDIEQLAALIEPAVKDLTDLESAVKANVRFIVNSFQKNGYLQKKMEEKKLECIGGYYDLASGKVEILK